MIFNSLLIFLSVLLVISAFEAALVLGLFDSSEASTGKPRKVCEGESAGVQFHDEYGWVMYPNATKLKKIEGEWRYITTNSEGFTDTYDSGSKDIVMLGDSFTAGAFVFSNSSFGYLLDRWTPDTSFQVYGQGGYGQNNEYAVYRDIRSRFNHSIVIIWYYVGNDMKDNADTNHRRPQFRVSDGDLVQTHEPARKPSESEAGGNQTQKEYQGNRDESTPLVQPIQDFLWQNTETYPFISRRFSRMTGGIDNPKPPDGDELERQLRLTQKLIGAFGQEARKSDADVLVVGIPTRGEIHPERPVSYLPEDGRPYWQSQRKMLENLSRRSENIEFLDLRPALRRAADRGALVYGRQNGHLNKKGHRIAAMTVHKWLIERGYVPARDIEYKSSFDLNRTTC